MKYPIFEKLRQLDKEGMYPFHMPGHKRQKQDIMREGSLFALDTTEISGFDDLHHPEGMIKESMEYVQHIYGSKESYFLINSTTGGILASVAASCRLGDKILISRNCHKSVYHAISMLGLRPVYLYPKIEQNICMGITKCQVQDILGRENGIKAAVIVSPTYEGIVSDIRQIAEVLHEEGIPLIVDEAHGAHFVFHSGFPESAVSQGADAVIQSLHKTLPSLTQTGLLHICSSRIGTREIQQALSTFQSSSPSYILMASIDYCVRKCADSPDLFDDYVRNLMDIRARLKAMRHLKLLKTDDPGKIVVSTGDTKITGKELFHILRGEYGIELEMSEISYVTAMTSICDTKEALDKLCEAFLETDESLHHVQNPGLAVIPATEQVMTPYEAKIRGRKLVSPAESLGGISADFIFLYPPGIPLAVPGERISGEIVQKINEYQEQKMNLIGLSEGRIYIVDERV